MTSHNLDSVIATLNEHQQRATYAAVAALVGQTPRTVMSSKPRSQENSWIVGVRTGVPTGYDESNLHPDLKKNDIVLRTREELEKFLAERGAN